MTRVEEFEELRPLRFAIAYGLLGGVSEAEDAVQETWLRYEDSATQPTSTKAFLSAVVPRISTSRLTPLGTRLKVGRDTAVDTGEVMMKRVLSTTAAAMAIAGVCAGPASAVSDKAGCVGQFSSFFAHGGGGMHRSEVARDFAHNARPAGRNVYSHVAQFHGTLEECFEQTED